MRTLLAFFLVSVTLRADFSYQSRVQFSGGEPIVTTRSIKGRKMAILTRKHNSVIDLDAQTLTEIDFNHKKYSVTPFDKWKKVVDDAAAKSTHETNLQVAIHAGANSSSNKLIGILNAKESVIDISGGALHVTVDTWVGVVPGYEQMRDFIDKLAEKLGYNFAAGLAEPLRAMPESWQGFDEGIKRMNRSVGAPIETTIKVEVSGKSLGECSIQYSNLAGGAQLAATFSPPDGFKKVDSVLP